MELFPFVFTVFLMLLGPIKLIPFFASVTRGMDLAFKRRVAIRAALIAAGLSAFVALAGDMMLDKYHISFEAVLISGSLVMLISALRLIFGNAPPTSRGSTAPSAMELAASPIAVPGIVPPTGVAVILIFVMLTPLYPGLGLAVGICLTIMMAFDFLAMYFIDKIIKTPGLTLVLTVLGAALVFVQVCFAIEIFLKAIARLGLIRA